MQIPIHYSALLFLSATAVVVLCICAEFKKSKRSDLKLDGKMCSLPQSSALGLGIAALITLFIGQIAANFFACREIRSAGGSRVKKQTVPCILLVLSWASFVMAVILLSVGSSMSRKQVVGEGWLEGECYLVKSGVYGASGFLGLLALGSATVATRGRWRGDLSNRTTTDK